MTPERFHSQGFGVTSDDLTIETTAGRYGDAWVIFACLGGDSYAVTQSRDVFTCCQWVAQLRRLEECG